MPDPQDFPGTYEVWSGGEQIATLPRYASKLKSGQYLTLDEVEYEIEKIEHVMTSIGAG